MTKQPKKQDLSYTEGTWFTIPLRQGGYAVGRVARRSPKGEIILAYFFGPKRETIPTLRDVEILRPGSAIKIAQVGALGIVEGSWPIIGDSPKWKREEWPIPSFIRKDEIGRIAWRVVYADDNPNRVISEQLIPYDTLGYEKDSLLGAGAAEVIVSRLLA